MGFISQFLYQVFHILQLLHNNPFTLLLLPCCYLHFIGEETTFRRLDQGYLFGRNRASVHLGCSQTHTQIKVEA